MRLQASDEAISVRLKELGETWESQAEEPVANGKKTAHSKHARREERPSSRDRPGSSEWRSDSELPSHRNGGLAGEAADGEAQNLPGRKRARQEEQQGFDTGRGNERPWLAMHIRVKIVDKGLHRGRQRPGCCHNQWILYAPESTFKAPACRYIFVCC